MRGAVLVLLLFGHAGCVSASGGDIQRVFKECAKLCTDVCEAHPTNDGERTTMLKILGTASERGYYGDASLIPEGIGEFTTWQRLLRWDCQDECKYHCMWYSEDHWSIADVKHSHGGRYLGMQYFGKWPFERYCHIQEPMSVIFSLGNLAVVVWVFLSYNRRTTPTYDEELHPKIRTMRSVILASYSLHVTAWLSATAFHMRDTWVTERMDYFSAAATVSFQCLVCAVCMLTGFNHVKLVVGVWLVSYAFHIHYLVTAPHFDYGWNMTYNIIHVVFETIVIPVWWYRVRADRPNAWKSLVFVLLLPIAAATEVMDFPPLWRLLDAHAIWHALSIPLGVLWGQSLLDDLDYMLELHKSPRLQR